MKKLFTARNIISAILVCAILAAGVGVLMLDPFSQATETEQESELDRIPIDRPYIQHTLPPDRLPVEPDDYPYGIMPDELSIFLPDSERFEFAQSFDASVYYFSKYVGFDNAEYFNKWFDYESGLQNIEMRMVVFVEHFNISRETFEILLNYEQARAQRNYDAYGGSLWDARSCFNVDIIFSGDSELIRNYYRDSHWITAQHLREQGITDNWVLIEVYEAALEQVAQEQAVVREQLATQAQEIAAARR